MAAVNLADLKGSGLQNSPVKKYKLVATCSQIIIASIKDDDEA